jgi:phosphoribosylanthranilate isomerase
MSNRIEIKFCGQTRPADAALGAAAGADAIGLIFHPASPRHVTPEQAREIIRALPADFPAVAVCVDLPPELAALTADRAGARILQLHGNESRETIAFLIARGFRVIKVLKTAGPDLSRNALALPAGCGILVECGKGPLPGGNAAAWNWAEARPLGAVRPFALAGGLRPDNVAEAIRAAQPSAVDLSSGIEDGPGRKNLEKMRQLVNNVRQQSITWPTAPIFAAAGPEGRPPCPHNR